MLQTLGSAVTLVLLIVYTYAGDRANYYIKYHLLNQRAEIYSDTGNYIMSRIIYAGILGWITIPIALLHYTFMNKNKD